MTLGWDGRSSEASGWEKELCGSRLGQREHSESRLGRKELGRSSRLRRWELGGSRLGWNDPIDSKLGQRKLGGSGLRSMAQPQIVRRGSRIQNGGTEGARQLCFEAEEARRLQAEE